MRLRHRRSPLLILLLPSLALASIVSDARDARADTDIGAAAAFQESTNAGSTTGKKYDVGTKDAPVDGRDGRPHQGPFVEIENLRKGEGGEKGETGDSKKDLPPLKDRPNDVTVVDGKKIPESNDGVMFDKDRPKPKDGTTGTSGGVSEKDKTRKAQEGKTGEKVENKPDPPKEAPPLPDSEEEKISGSDKPKTKGKTDVKTPEEVAGLDVRPTSLHFIKQANSSRNRPISPTRRTTRRFPSQNRPPKTTSTSPREPSPPRRPLSTMRRASSAPSTPSSSP